jgi:O-antigen/teichoic acid export membrane protein
MVPFQRSLMQRILKNLAALLTGRVVAVVQQVVVPPVFIARYGAAGFGEWGALSGAVAALGLLNFGVQTYMNQDLAVRYQSGETEGYRVRQSTALRLLLGGVAVAAVLCLAVFLLPFDTWLRLDISRTAAQWTLYLLALQILLSIPFGYLGGIFMGVGLAHRGAHWNNVRALTSSLALLLGVVLHVRFAILAAGQLACLAACVVGVLIDLRRTAPQVYPTLHGWDGAAVGEILHGSGYFGLIMMSTFLTYEAPLLVLQRIVGPVAVAGFILMRTIFSVARQVLGIITQSMGAEITNLYGRRDWPALARLFASSERLVLWLISAVNLGVLMGSPVLITLWLHRRGSPQGVSSLFAVTPYVLSAALSMVISLKEHKFIFQFSTNTHVDLARTMFWSYVAMVAVSVGTVHVAGVTGFLWTWLAVESLQTVRLMTLNRRLFAGVAAPGLVAPVVSATDRGYVTRLVVLCAAGLAAAVALLPRTSTLGLGTQAALAVGVSVLVAVLGWRVFGMGAVAGMLRQRLARQP